MTEVIMPKMGDGMEEGTLVEWLKAEGDHVRSGEVIGTIQTDKATLELESPGTGTLAGLLVRAGETVPVGRPIAAILREGETLPPDWASRAGRSSNGAPASKADVRAPAPVESSPTGPARRVKASPLARKLAEDAGLDLSLIQGSGPHGRILERDVRAAIAKLSPVAAPPVAEAREAPAVRGEERVVELNRLRQITAQRTAESKQQIPHFYVTVEVDGEALQELRAMFERGGTKLSVNDFVLKACAMALVDMPQVNSIFQGKTLLDPGTVNIGMAVALEDGLTVPVLKNVQEMTVRQISAASKDLAQRARENRLSLDELGGSTFSVSNMGMLDVDNFIAIINQPNAAILAVSTMRRKVVPVGDDEIGIRWRMNLTGSFDHRVVDGAVAAKFMNTVKGYLENPTRLIG